MNKTTLLTASIISALAGNPYNEISFKRECSANGMYIPKRSMVIKNKRKRKRNRK